MTTVFLGLGSNLGDSRANLLRALNALHSPEVRVHQLSSCYRSQPVGPQNQPVFRNAVCRLACRLTAIQLLQRCQEIERRLGRIRRERWGPREIDLDILYFGTAVLDLPGLIVPHPRIVQRRFVLVPMVELDPHWVDPVSRRTMLQLLQDCPDTSAVQLDRDTSQGHAS